jgi:zinc/manganese transport system ATP-binding protein
VSAAQPAPAAPEDGPTSTDGSSPLVTTSEVLAVRDVTVRLGGREVLRNVSFTVRAGDVTGLIGLNGAGKTTLLRVILGLQPATSGTVSIAGNTRDRSHPTIGYVPQKFLLDPDLPLRARDVVALGLDGHRLGIPLPSRRREQRVDEALRAVGAEHFGKTRVGNLSGGEQQRVLIAHALVSRPKLLLLDEPLANLDIVSAQEVVDLLAGLAHTQGIAVFISAHEMNTLLPVMDRSVYLADGRAAAGTVDEVVRSAVLSDLYGHHVDVLRLHGRVLVVPGAGIDAGEATHDITVLPPGAHG